MIRRADLGDLDLATDLSLLLFPGHTRDELLWEMRGALGDAGQAVFLSDENGTCAGFAHCGLRHDYVEGSGTSPVGYLEALYVLPPFRRRGLARALTHACERWAAALGCSEFASDCALQNDRSIAFHLGAGFQEAGRLVCFIKPIEQPRGDEHDA